MITTLKKNFPMYLTEAFCLGMFMVSALFFTILIEHPDFWARQTISSGFVRRLIIGLMMGLTAICLIYSPWGKLSGAHMNPAVTLTFLRLNKIERSDAFFYVIFQCIGGLIGVGLFYLLAAMYAGDSSVKYAVTVPLSENYGEMIAFVFELLMSFGMMSMVLFSGDFPRLSRLTGILAGCMVFLYITFEAPYSGMSINPARTLASALPANTWNGFWIYLLAPPLGMLLAAEVYLLKHKGNGSKRCGKLCNINCNQCIFKNCQCMS